MKSVYFVTPTLLSHLDLFSMGGSDKADDDTLVGKYNSGLCYSMALALRDDVDMSVRVVDTESTTFDKERKRETYYSFSTYEQICEQTEKEKSLIQIHKNVLKESFFSQHREDLEGGDYPEEIIQTGYSVKLGVDWELWMLLREIFSNMIDEGGSYYEDICPTMSHGTVFKLVFDEDSKFGVIWNNRHLYINEKEPLYKISDRVEALENVEGYLRIYKQNILVYSDEKVPSKFAYNVKLGEIDERRILSNVYNVESSIVDAIRYTQNEEFLRQIITRDFKPLEKEFLSNFSNYYTASDLIHNIAVEVYTEFGEVSSYDWLIDSVKKRKDCKIGGKIIKTIDDSVWLYSVPVRIETTPTQISEPSIEVDGEIYDSSFSAEIKKYYNFNLDCEVRVAKLKGSKAVADKFEKCIIVDESFDIQTDFGTFMIEYIDLSYEGNAVKCLGEYIVKLLRK